MQTIASRSRLRPLGRAWWWRYTLLAHRYVGIAVGLVVTLWCLSGVVMMYMPYPALDDRDQLATLEPLDLGRCCNGRLHRSLSELPLAPGFRVEMLQGSVLLRIPSPQGQHLYDLSQGRWVETWPRETLLAQGHHFAAMRGWSPPVSAESLAMDQWTVYSRYHPHRPLLKFANRDGQQWYVSSRSAEIVQATTAHERFWNWLGAVPHWLYPTLLRKHTALWAQVVIWLTLISLFLSITGVIIGIRQYRRPGKRRASPYRGWGLWHHYAGLVFGLFILTWLSSGLFSMNPWGLLESRSFALERERLHGTDITLGELVTTLRGLKGNLPEETVRLTGAQWQGTIYLLAENSVGNRFRLDANGPVAGIAPETMRKVAAELREGSYTLSLLQEPDAYYYGHKENPEFPIYRLQYDDEERLYVSPTSGFLVTALDGNARRLRWLFEALHRGDFAAWARQRPVWDLLMLPLLLGVTVAVASGTYLGFRRLRR